MLKKVKRRLYKEGRYSCHLPMLADGVLVAGVIALAYPMINRNT